MPDRLRAALIGCGHMGAWTRDRVRRNVAPGWLPLSHAEGITSVEGYELIACADPDREAREKTAERYGIPEAFADAHELIEAVRPDVVAVATRTPGRCDILLHAIEVGVRGIHAEKPLGNHLGEIRRVIGQIMDRGVAFTYGATRRFMPIFSSARDMVEQGGIGNLEQVTVELGRTLLMWSHPHSTDLLVYMTGGAQARQVRAVAELEASGLKGGSLDADPLVRFAHVDFAGGVDGVISSARGMNLRLDGSDARLSVEGDGSRLVRTTGEGGPYRLSSEQLKVAIERSGTQEAFARLRDAVLRGAQVRGLPPLQVLQAHEILFAIGLSAMHGGEAVVPGEVGDDFVITGQFNGMVA